MSMSILYYCLPLLDVGCCGIAVTCSSISSFVRGGHLSGQFPALEVLHGWCWVGGLNWVVIGYKLQYDMGEHIVYSAGDVWRWKSYTIVLWSIVAVAKVLACSQAISVSLVHSCSSISFPHLILYCVMLCMSLLNSFHILYRHVR